MSNQHVHIDRRRWELVRRKAFERDGWRCLKCGLPSALEAHHEPPLRDGADPYDLAGVRALCRGCHIARHRGDAMTPGRAAWLDFVCELVDK